MRPILAMSLMVILVLIGLPAFVVGSWNNLSPAPPELEYNPTIRLFISSTNQIVQLTLEEYIKGVIAAEMPASFHEEALKAQAIAARTYAVKRIRELGGKGCSSHPQADLCDSPAHCQAWLPNSELQKRWGMIDYQQYWSKISHAVEATAGLIITYNGVAIDPLFHSTCGGHTEDAGNVWQRSEPYLVPVACTHCQHSPRLETESRFSLLNFLSAMKQVDSAVAVTASDVKARSNSVAIAATNQSGRVQELIVGGRSIKATTVRYALGLNSTRFSYEILGDQIVFKSIGYGHGVGMCQYGADGMGKAGQSYEEIIKFYYQGTMLSKLR